MDTDKTIFFQPGLLYSCKSPCDSGCVWSFIVVRRTAKTVTLIDTDGTEKTVKPFIHNGAEAVKPLGNYSMCPILRAG
jgi:hypothetical protein